MTELLKKLKCERFFGTQCIFGSFDFNCDLMTLMYELDLPVDILKMYLRTKNEVSSSKLSEVRA